MTDLQRYRAVRNKYLMAMMRAKKCYEQTDSKEALRLYVLSENNFQKYDILYKQCLTKS